MKRRCILIIFLLSLASAGALLITRNHASASARHTFLNPALVRTAKALDAALVEKVKANNVAGARHLLDRGASPNACEHINYPLETMPRSFKELVDRWQARRAGERNDIPVLYQAACFRDRDAMIDLLLARGADPNLPGDNNVTPLMAAADRGDLATMTKLLDRGANIDTHEGRGRTTLMSVAGRWHGVSGERAGVSYVRHSPVLQGRVLRLLLARGANPNLRTQVGTAFEQAIAGGDLAATRLLLDHGAHARTVFTSGYTSLMQCASSLVFARPAGGSDHGAVMQLLLARGVDVNAKANNGDTALRLAKRARRPDIVALLVKAGATR